MGPFRGYCPFLDHVFIKNVAGLLSFIEIPLLDWCIFGLGADGGGWEPTVVGWEPTVVGREGRGQRGTRKVLPRAPDRGRDENLGYSSRPPSNQSFYLSLGSAGRKFELKTARNVRFHI